MIRKVIIIGSGPAGYTAALYLARAKLAPLVLAGEKHGGQLMLTTDVENYPGFEAGILGPELMEKMRQQAVRFGAEIVDRDVTKVDLTQKPFKIHLGGVPTATSEVVVIATGAESKLLDVPGEKELMGRGVSTCAVCDAPFYKDKVTFVVGGGDAAMEEALALVKWAAAVTIVHRGSEFRASKIMQDRVLVDNQEKIQVLWNSQVKAIKGQNKVEQIVVVNSQTGEKIELAAEGVFIAIGYKPATDIFKGQIELNEKSYVVVGKNEKYPTMTSVPGVFAAGDVVDFRYRQAVTAAGMGCAAALDGQWWLERHD